MIPSTELPRHAVIREVGLRDGLQSIACVVPTAAKLEWIQRRLRARASARSRLAPSCRRDCCRSWPTRPRCSPLPGPCPASGRRCWCPTSRAPSGRWNARRSSCCCLCRPATRTASPICARHPTKWCEDIARIRGCAGRQRHPVRRSRWASARPSAARFRDGWSLKRWCDWSSAAIDAGADAVGLADTVGYADPGMVRSLFEAVLPVAGDKLNCGHFHDTRGLGLANVYAALRAGHHALRCLHRRYRRLPARAGRQRQRGDRRRGLHASQHGHPDRPSTSTPCWPCAARSNSWLEGESLSRHALARRACPNDDEARSRTLPCS